MSQPASATVARSRVAAWALWDSGTTGLSAIVTTFVFSVYLTSSVGVGIAGGTKPESWLGRAAAVAGLTIAVLAPGIGVWVESPHRRRVALSMLTGMAVVLATAMYLIRPQPLYFWVGLVLMAGTAACTDLASVPYNAMLRQLSTPATSGRISGFGYAAGYGGTALLLLLAYFGLFYGEGDKRGLLHVPVHDGLYVRIAMLLAAAWLAVSALPLLLVAQRLPDANEGPQQTNIVAGYRKLWSQVRTEWRRDRNLVYFLVASALFRDGLSAIFGFGAVLGVSVYGVSRGDVLIFGVAALVVAAVGAVLGGFADHRIGSKPVIIGSLLMILGVAITLMCLSGRAAFWACGLLLCLFIGPAQSSSRTLLLHMAKAGQEGMAFGLYTMTGRAAQFVAPTLFSVFVDIFGVPRAGMGGIAVVLVAGILAMLVVRVPPRRVTVDEPT